MLTCDLSVNGQPVGRLTARRTDRMNREGFVYVYRIETSDGHFGRTGVVRHRPVEGIWALVQRVIEVSHPEKWFPCPDRKEGA